MALPEALIRAEALFLVTDLTTRVFDNAAPAKYAEMPSQPPLKPCPTWLT